MSHNQLISRMGHGCLSGSRKEIFFKKKSFDKLRYFELTLIDRDISHQWILSQKLCTMHVWLVNFDSLKLRIRVFFRFNWYYTPHRSSDLFIFCLSWLPLINAGHGLQEGGPLFWGQTLGPWSVSHIFTFHFINENISSQWVISREWKAVLSANRKGNGKSQ